MTRGFRCEMPTEAVFVDREAERGALDSLVASARQSKSGALVLYGDAGMGKTVLLDYASSAQGFHVVRMAGIETEQTFGFGALHRLFSLSTTYLISSPRRNNSH
jgi:hypothetical protein